MNYNEFNIEDLPMFDFHAPTEEELEQVRKERNIELEKKDFYQKMKDIQKQ